MELRSLICPDTKDCPIYKEWAKLKKTKKIAVLEFDIVSDYYSCIAKAIFPSDTLCLNEEIANIPNNLEKMFKEYNKK